MRRYLLTIKFHRADKQALEQKLRTAYIERAQDDLATARSWANI